MEHNSSILNGLFFQKHSTTAMNTVFCDTSYLQKLLQVECALATSQAELGIIPKEAAAKITEMADAKLINMHALYEASTHTNHPFIPALKAFTELCGDAGKFVHWGATTQDILDSATILQLKEAFEIVFSKLLKLNKQLCESAKAHQHTLMIGRTNGQQALPITLGFKFAVWLAETQRHIQRLLDCQERLWVGQFAGAVGTLASFGDNGIPLRKKFTENLGLKESSITWNTSRDNLAELASLIGIMASTLGKIGQEVFALQKQEIAELEEHVEANVAGSSTMPHKKNPFISQEIVSDARMLKSVVRDAFDALEVEHERDPRSLNIENNYLPRLFQLTDHALENTLQLLSTLKVNQDNMIKNLNTLNGVIFSEAVMMQLTIYVGKAEAHHIIFEASMESLQQKRPFKQVLLNHHTVQKHLVEEQIDKLLEPKNYLGSTEQLIKDVLSDNEQLWQSKELNIYL